MNILNRFMNKSNNVSFSLKIKIQKYVEYLYKKEKI